MKIRLIFLTVFLLIFIVLQLEYYMPLEHRILFSVNFGVLFIFTILYMFSHKQYAPFIAAYIVFSFLFFIVAPILQIDDFFTKTNKRFFNGLIYSNELIFKANILIIIFHLSFFLTYFTFYKKRIPIKIISKDSKLPFYILLFFVINLIVFFWKYDYLMVKIGLVSVASITSKMNAILNAKFFLYLPFAPIVLGIDYLKSNWKDRKTNFYIIGFIVVGLLILFIFYKNPLIEKRNALGPIYITLIFFLIPKWVNTNFKILTLMFVSLVVIFPASSLLTHSNKDFSEISFSETFSKENVKERVSDQFTSLNFDAFLMVATTIDYTEKVGFTKGRQLLPTLLFFVPRYIWDSKPITSGELMGEHIQKYHDENRWFHNLSDPFVAEAYLDFGFLGVLLYPMLLALLCLKFVNWLQSNDPLRQLAAFYFAIHLIFLLRGDLTNGYVYYVLPFMAFYVFPKFIMKIFK